MVYTLSKFGRRFAAGFLSVWLSGVVLLLCCADMNAGVAEAKIAEAAHMSAHCDKMGKTETELNPDSESVSRHEGELDNDCCAFLPMLFDKKRVVEGKWQIAAATQVAVVEMPRPTVELQNFAAVQFYRPHPLSRDGTYLKNRTFRI